MQRPSFRSTTERIENTSRRLKTNKKMEFPGSEQPLYSQFGAICWRLNRGKVEVLLVTSRDTGRWVIPKGWPVDNLTAPASAAREAWEEAGVEGQVSEASLGVYTYDKRRLPKPPLPCAVMVFPLRVARMADKFPERKERQRRWFPARKAARLVDEPELREIFSQLDREPSLLTETPS